MVGLCEPTTLEDTFLRFKGYMTKSNTCLFATVLCLIPENVFGRPLKKNKKKREMDWQLVASYFTVKSTDIFAVHEKRG